MVTINGQSQDGCLGSRQETFIQGHRTWPHIPIDARASVTASQRTANLSRKALETDEGSAWTAPSQEGVGQVLFHPPLRGGSVSGPGSALSFSFPARRFQVRTVALIVVLTTAILGCQSSPKAKPATPSANPYPVNSNEWWRYEKEGLAQRLEATDPDVGRRWRQIEALQNLKVGIRYNPVEVGIPDRSIQMANAGGSATTHVYDSSGSMGRFVTRVTVDDRTGIVTAIVRETNG